MNNSPAALAQWKDLLRFVMKETENPLYRTHYASKNFDPEQNFATLADIERVPLLTKAVLAAAPGGLRFVPWADVRNVSPTSGTTSGTPLVTYYAPSAHAVWSTENADLGTTLVLMSPTRAGSILYHYFMRDQLAMLGDTHNLPTTCELASQIGTRTIMTTPTMAIILKKYLDAYPAVYRTLRYIRLGGELITPKKKQLVASMYPDCIVYSVYASSEAGRVAAQCPTLAERQDVVWYHVPPTHHFVEVIDPTTGARVPNGTRGELVVTDFTNRATPFIRYRTGDEVRFVPEQCTCGSTDPLIELFGRIGRESVRAGGFELRRDMFEHALLGLSGVIRPDFEAHIHETYTNATPTLRIVLHLALAEDVPETPELLQKITDELLEHWRFSPKLNARAAMAAGLLAPLEIVFTTFPVEAKAVGRLILH